MPSVDTCKTVVIHQPDFMPYPGFFHRLLNADMFVVLDHVQFLRNSKSWHHRDLIKSPQGA
ncbi:MAG: WbqC family protein, partial [Desulfobacterales bacterium]|nr:WbqC family protein [Desulfobacterales bacterium]